LQSLLLSVYDAAGIGRISKLVYGKEPSMQSESTVVPNSKAVLWTGRVLSFLPALFLLFDAVMKFIQPEVVVKTTVELGYSQGVILPLGIVLLLSTILYLLPPTAGLGAILLTGYLGGAVAAHLRHGDGPFAILFPVVFGILLWTGLILRDRRLRAVVPRMS